LKGEFCNTPIKRSCIFIAIIVVFFLKIATAHAQFSLIGDDSSAVRANLTGGITLSSDFYNLNTSAANFFPARRPAVLTRLVATPTFTLNESITFPVTIIVSLQETNTITPFSDGTTFGDFVLNQLNTIGVAPKFGWAQTYLGSHIPQYSDLSVGNIQIFGAGTDLRPGIFRFSANAGVAQRPIERDSLRGISGAYMRWLYAAKLGIGSESGFLADLNFVKARDEQNSIERKPAGLTPQESILSTLNLRWNIIEGLVVNAEAGASVFTRDMNAPEITEVTGELPHFAQSLLRPTISTRADYAGTASMSYDEAIWGVKLAANYIGEGYATLGFPFMQADRFDVTLSPRVQFLDGKVFFNGAIGTRINNISGTNAAPLNQLLSSANLTILPIDILSLNLNYSNFGQRTNVREDSLRVQNVAQAFGINPVLTLTGDDLTHSISFGYNHDDFTEMNVVTRQEQTNLTQTITGAYTAVLRHIPFTATLALTHLTNDLPLAPYTLNNATISGSYRFLEDALVPTLGLTFARNTVGSGTADTQIFARAGLQWRFISNMTFTVNFSTNNYQYGSARNNADFQEHFAQTALSWQF